MADRPRDIPSVEHASLRVLQVVEATTAGVGRHVLELSVGLQQAGHAVTVACPAVREGAQRDTGFVDRLRAAGVPIALVPMRRSLRPLADWRAYRALARLIGLQSKRYDVIHCHSSKAGALGRLAARRAAGLSRPAVVYTPHAFAFLGAGRLPQRWFYRAVERWLGRTATDLLICDGPSELALARQRADRPGRTAGDGGRDCH